MNRTYFAALTCLALFLGNASAQDAAKEPPSLFKVKEIGKDTIDFTGPGSTVCKSYLRDLDCYDAAGKKVAKEDFVKRIKVGSIVVVSGDENMVDPSYLGVLKEDTFVLVGVTVLTARADRPGRGWTMDMKLMNPTVDPVVGRMNGAEFKLDSIQLLNTGLSLRAGKDWIHIFLNLKPGVGIEGTSFEYDADVRQGRPAIHLHIQSSKGAPAFGGNYAMRLEFGRAVNGVVPGKIYLCLPDEKKSWIAGSFDLKLQ